MHEYIIWLSKLKGPSKIRDCDGSNLHVDMLIKTVIQLAVKISPRYSQCITKEGSNNAIMIRFCVLSMRTI